MRCFMHIFELTNPSCKFGLMNLHNYNTSVGGLETSLLGLGLGLGLESSGLGLDLGLEPSGLGFFGRDQQLK